MSRTHMQRKIQDLRSFLNTLQGSVKVKLTFSVSWLWGNFLFFSEILELHLKKRDYFLKKVEFQTAKSLRYVKLDIKKPKLLAISIIFSYFRYISLLPFLNHYQAFWIKINDTPDLPLHTQTNGEDKEITNYGKLLRGYGTTAKWWEIF